MPFYREAQLTVCVCVDGYVAVTFIWTVGLYAAANTVFSANHFALASCEVYDAVATFCQISPRSSSCAGAACLIGIYCRPRHSKRAHPSSTCTVTVVIPRRPRKTFKTQMSAGLFVTLRGENEGLNNAALCGVWFDQDAFRLCLERQNRTMHSGEEVFAKTLGRFRGVSVLMKP